MTAYLVEHNDRSRRLAERSGLQLVWRGPDDPAAPEGDVRLIYSDRDLPDDVLRRLVP